jgi:hypothetical protein
MSEWWTYTFSDFLMFSPQVYYRLFELHNRALWPAQLLTMGAGFAIFYLLLRGQGGKFRVMAIMLGMLWIWLAWAFFWERYATINWAAAYVAPFIAFEGLLLIGFGAIRGGAIFRSSREPSALAGLGLFACALVLYPFVALFMGRLWLSAEIFGIAPDPTAIATLALLALAAERTRWLLMLVPALWCVISSVTLWTMGADDFFLPIAGALAAIGVGFAATGRAGSRPAQI